MPLTNLKKLLNIATKQQGSRKLHIERVGKKYFTMKFINILLGAILFFSSCSKDNSVSNPTNPTTPSGDYASYDFYLSDKGCGVVDEFTKNFQNLIGYEKAENFNVMNNNIYTYGAKKYRSTPVAMYYTLSDNYSGTINKNGLEIYSNIGGNSSSVFGIQEVGADLYYATGFKSQEGVVSRESLVCVPKIWKNGIIIDSLKGPFNNGGTTIGFNKGYGIEINEIFVKGGNVYVGGICYNWNNSEQSSIGYWKNGLYTELYRGSFLAVFPKFYVNDNEDIFYYFNTKTGKNLFKNNTNILNGVPQDFGFKDFALLNNDIYLMGTHYDNGYKLELYKNGSILYSTPLDNYTSQCKLNIIDNKIFISGYGIGSDNKMSIYEYKQGSNSLVKIGSTNSDYQGCTNVNILSFQVIKK